MEKSIEHSSRNLIKEELSRCVNEEGKGKLLLLKLIEHLSPFVDGQDWADHSDYWDRHHSGVL